MLRGRDYKTGSAYIARACLNAFAPGFFMLTMTSQEIDYVAASFKAWCVQHKKPAPTAEDAEVYFTYVQHFEPSVAELLNNDWDDFLAFLRERGLLV